MSPVSVYKCFADDTRLKILLLLLTEQELCVCELIEALALSQPKISRHLALLREHELVQARKSGQWVYYSINSNLPTWVLGCLNQCALENADYIQVNLQALTAMKDRPSKCCN